MKFNGVIQKVLPLRSGVSERSGKEWATQAFVFEYKENPTDRTPDRVILETFDTNVIAEFEKVMVKDGEGKPVVENATISLTRPLYASVGFYHKTRVYTNKQGQTGIMNDLSIYDFQWLKQPQTPPQPAQASNVQQTTNSPQPQNNAPTGGENQGGQGDDLPF
jgi:hypothetical protein